jgi:hypothetical protein
MLDSRMHGIGNIHGVVIATQNGVVECTSDRNVRGQFQVR